MFFLLTSACGSALWVADIEREKQRQALARLGVESENQQPYYDSARNEDVDHLVWVGVNEWNDEMIYA